MPSSDRAGVAAAGKLVQYLKANRPSPRVQRLLSMIRHLEAVEPNRIYLCLPMGGETMLTRFFTQWLELEISYHDVESSQGVYLPAAHNGMVRHFLERKDCEWIGFIEHDHHLDMYLLARVRSYGPEHKIVGAAYMTRDVDQPAPMLGELDEKGLHYMRPSVAIPLLSTPQLTRTSFVPMGCTFIRREVFEKIPPPWFRTMDNPNDPEDDIGDDVYFCRLAQEHGFEIYVDTALQTGHYGVHEITPRWYMERLRYRFLEQQFGHLVPFELS